MTSQQHPREPDEQDSYKQAVAFWRRRRRGITPTFVCPQWTRRKGDGTPHQCGVINCPEFMADLHNRAVVLSEREEFVRLNGFDPEILLKKVRNGEGYHPAGVQALRAADLPGSSVGRT